MFRRRTGVSVPLPPAELRPGGPLLLDDEEYRRFASATVGQLLKYVSVTEDSRLLDLGCGPGRLLIGLLQEQVAFGSYVGIDVHGSAIAWADEALAAGRANVRFSRVDAPNDRYNANGTQPVHIPLEDASCDVITLVSVFSHMRLDDVREHLHEIARVISPDGSVFLTAFVELHVPTEEENPAGYLEDWKGPLHCVRFDRHAFERLAADAGLLVRSFGYREHRGIQSIYVLQRG